LQHAGIVLVYQGQADVVRAILEGAGVAFAGFCHVLNAWRY